VSEITTKHRRAVVAIGGNALHPGTKSYTREQQLARAGQIMSHLADWIEDGWEIVIIHGNGPQIGELLEQHEHAAGPDTDLSLDILGAQTQGLTGYLLQQCLGQSLRNRGIGRSVVTLLTQVLVSCEDPAFQNPDKPIGRFYSSEDAKKLAQHRGQIFHEDSGRGWRRVVPSPKPLEVVELDAVKGCLAEGIIPIVAGGGGIPVFKTQKDTYIGASAVIDKDRTAALLASRLNAQRLLLCTSVSAVQVHFGTPQAQILRDVDPKRLKDYCTAGEFPAGSMGPKIEAALEFLNAKKPRDVIITDQHNLALAWQHKAGTHIVSDSISI
jgi:carbamate kinase